MSKFSKPKITKCKSEYTKVTFCPDLKRFGMTHLNEDIVAMMTKRVYDLAGCTDKSVRVFLNGQRISFKKFSDYVNLYLPDEVRSDKVYAEPNDRWQICVCPSDGHHQHVSFVNSISTWKGGSHVKHVTEKIVKKLVDYIKKKHKTKTLKPAHVRNQLFVFVNALIENPAFDSQTKENLTSKQSTFGTSCTISDDFMKKIYNSGIVENVLSWTRFKEKKQLKKNDGKKKVTIGGIPKLEDANFAGGRFAHQCTLILTEGDSAKALAMSGLSIVGRDYYGVFPLRGKLLNVRDASSSSVAKNAEISNLKKILGLQQTKKYQDVKQLRYGSVMIMTDQDHDGSHIKGLLINFFHTYWPGLLKIPGFLKQFITPIVRARKGSQVHSYFTIPEYLDWKNSLTRNQLRKWSIKYYKGLGTSTSQEAKEYFSNLDRHLIDFEWADDVKDEEKIIMAFSKKKVDDRKTWLGNFVAGTFMDYQDGASAIPYHKFVDDELILYSNADNFRSIPNVLDGLKPGQRKIMFSCFKKNLKKEMKVAQLAGIVSQLSAYHHGEVSLCSTIVCLAQDYVGSNNVNLLTPAGQFGTRHMAGKDAASPRYIFTSLEPLSRTIYHPSDDAILKYLDDDGESVEPEWYVPVIPMVLVNGAEGIGTGYSTFIPNYNPEDIVSCLKQMLSTDCTWRDLPEIHPWYRNFTGEIEVAKRAGSYSVEGVLETVEDNKFRITELPLRKCTESYKEHLESLMGDSNIVKEFEAHHSDLNVDFLITLAEGLTVTSKSYSDWITIFKLKSSISIKNMVAFDMDNRIRKFESPAEMIGHFYDVRLRFYDMRKEYLVNELTLALKKLTNKANFIKSFINGGIVIANRKKDQIIADLRKFGFERFESSLTAEVESDSTSDSGFDYLLSMKLWSLSKEKIENLHDQVETKQLELDIILEKSVKDLWLHDLETFIEEYRSSEIEKEKERDIYNTKNKKRKKTQKVPKKNKIKKSSKHEIDAGHRENLKQTFEEIDRTSTIDSFLNTSKKQKAKPVKKTKPKAAGKKSSAKMSKTSADRKKGKSKAQALDDLWSDDDDDIVDLSKRLTATKKVSTQTSIASLFDFEGSKVKSKDTAMVLDSDSEDELPIRRSHSRRARRESLDYNIDGSDEDKEVVSHSNDDKYDDAVQSAESDWGAYE